MRGQRITKPRSLPREYYSIKSREAQDLVVEGWIVIELTLTHVVLRAPLHLAEADKRFYWSE